MSAPNKRNNTSQRGGKGKGGRGQGKNPFANDPVQKEADKIKQATAKVNESFSTIVAQIRTLQNSEYMKKIIASRTYLKENVYTFLDEIKAEENKIKAEMNRQKEERKKFYEELREVLPIRQKRDQPFQEYIQRNLDAVDRELSDLQSQLLNIRSLNEEKQITSAIDKTRAKRRQIASYEEHKGESTNFGAKLDALRDRKKQYVDDLAKHKAIIAENQKLHDVNTVKITALKAELDKLQTKRDELHKQYNEKKKELDAKWVVWKKEQEELKKKRAAEYKERKEKEKKEREEEEAQRKLEEASRPPMMKELAAVEALINYVNGLKYNKKKPAAKLNHSLDAFGNFSEFKLVPPQRGRDVAEAKKALEAKKAEIVALQEEALKKRAEEAAKKAEEEKNAPPPAEEAPAAKEEPEAAAAEEEKAEEPAATEEAEAATEDAPAEEVAEEAPAASED